MSKIDYDLTKIKGVVFDIDGVLSPVCIPMDNNGIPRRMANLRDGYAIQLAVRQGLKICIISGANDQSIERRFKALGVQDVYLITGSKVECLRNWMKQNGLEKGEVAYAGDDIPDSECMKYVGLPVAPKDAAAEIKSLALYITAASGGHGVARELLEQILKARKLWPSTANANGL